MRLLSLFKKTFIENVRDWKVLVLTLLFAPLSYFSCIYTSGALR